MFIKTNGTLGHAIAEYTGRRVLELDVIADPIVPGTYAMRAMIDEIGPLQFLVCDIPLRQVTENDLEECEFTTWPPRSEPLAPRPAAPGHEAYDRSFPATIDPRD